MNTLHSRRSWIPLVVVAALLPVACGSDDDSGADAGTSDAGTSDAGTSDATAGADTTVATAGADTTAATPADTEDGGGSPVDVAIVSVADGFSPPAVSVAAGTEVVWTNVDALTHTTSAEDGSWDSGNLGVSQSFSFVPTEPGTYAYFCAIHPSMVGELVVE